MAWTQLLPHSAVRISNALLDIVYQKSFAPRHGMMRVRIIDREVYVKKLVGWGVLGENWSDRQLNWIEGI